MESTMVEFWAMIWERKSHAILMLGHLEENGKVCTPMYTAACWPPQLTTMT